MLLSETSPTRIVRLLLDQRLKVEILIVLVRLSTRIAEKTLLIQLLSDLSDT